MKKHHLKQKAFADIDHGESSIENDQKLPEI